MMMMMMTMMILILLILQALFYISVDALKSDKILVMIAGSFRGGPLAWKSLKLHMLDYYEADLLIVGPETASDYVKPLREIANYVFDFPDRDDWGITIIYTIHTSLFILILHYTRAIL